MGRRLGLKPGARNSFASESLVARRSHRPLRCILSSALLGASFCRNPGRGTGTGAVLSRCYWNSGLASLSSIKYFNKYEIMPYLAVCLDSVQE